jgi:hypothetical protein
MHTQIDGTKINDDDMYNMLIAISFSIFNVKLVLAIQGINLNQSANHRATIFWI